MRDQEDRAQGSATEDNRFLDDAIVVRVTRAQPPPAVRGVAILIGALGEIGSSRSEEDHQEKSTQFEREAAQIAQALCASLPGGTLDRLLIALLQHRASRLIVAQPMPHLPDPGHGR
jgi:hypothetical protein